MDVVEGLQKARDHISNPRMWFKGGDYSENGSRGALRGEPCCALGALMWSSGGDNTFYSEMFDYLRFACPIHGGVTNYNDRPNTKHKDIMALFDRAIKKAKGAP